MKNVMMVVMVFLMVPVSSFASDGPRHEKKEQSQAHETEKCCCCKKEEKNCDCHEKEKNDQDQPEVKKTGVKLIK